MEFKCFFYYYIENKARLESLVPHLKDFLYLLVDGKLLAESVTTFPGLIFFIPNFEHGLFSRYILSLQLLCYRYTIYNVC